MKTFHMIFPIHYKYMRRQTFLNTALYLFAFLAIQFAVVFIAYIIDFATNAGNATHELSAAATTVATLVSSLLTIALFYWRRWTPCTGEYINQRPWFTLCWVACLAVGVIIPNSLLTEWLGFEMNNNLEQLFEGMMSHRLGFITIGIVVPIAEEFVFRGAILRALNEFMGKRRRWVAIAVSALLFALVHGNLAQGVGAFLIGLALGWMYVRTNSVVPGIVLHWVNNSIAVVLYKIYPESATQNITDLFGGDTVRIALAVLFSLMICGASLYQLNLRLAKPKQC